MPSHTSLATPSTHTLAAGASSSRAPPPGTHELINSLQALSVSAGPSSNRGPAPFNLMVMVADPTGNGPVIRKEVARADLGNAWRGRVYIDQVTDNLFLAGFAQESAMLSVMRNQPWILRSQNLLLELYVPGRNRDDYGFQFMDASVRLYGIPRALRTEERVNEIIQQIGEPSDFHRMNPRTFNYDPYFLQTRIKLDVTKPAKDKVFLYIPEMGTMVVWIHYEKIKRICTYCAGYFHNSEHCPVRLRRTMTTGSGQGFGNHGGWMAQWVHIPMVLVENQINTFQGLTAPPSPILSALREAFAGVTMGASSVQNRRVAALPSNLVRGGNFAITHTHPTQQTTHQDAMLVDQPAFQPTNQPQSRSHSTSSNAQPTQATGQLQLIQARPALAHEQAANLATQIQNTDLHTPAHTFQQVTTQ